MSLQYEWDKVFPDTHKGAIDCLKAQSQGITFTKATAIPDPQVNGVWKVLLPAHDKKTEDGRPAFAIVYMKGHKDPFGQVRETNDFKTNIN